MKLISLGECNKNLIYPLIGGISKLVVNLILYLFKEERKLNNHPFLLGINAGIGMSLAIFPYLYIRRYTKITTNEHLNNNKFIDDINKKNNPVEKRDKYILIFLCAFLDFTQKILVFLFSYSITNNFWLFNIFFLNLFTSLITKNQIYKHQYFSSGIMIFFGIGLNIVNLYKIKVEDIPLVIISMLIEIIYSLCIVLAKYGMDVLFCSPFEITFYEGIFSLILNIIFLIISTNIQIPFEKVSFFSQLFKISEYNMKQYLDNFYTYIDELDSIEVLCFIVTMIGRVAFNLFSHITIKYYTSSHVVLLLIMGEISLDWNDKDKIEVILTAIIFAVEFFMLLVFCEIIELNFCGFEINTRKNISERAKIVVFDDDDVNSKEIGDGLVLSSEDSSSSINIVLEERN